jgi:hypothetical protein
MSYSFDDSPDTMEGFDTGTEHTGTPVNEFDSPDFDLPVPGAPPPTVIAAASEQFQEQEQEEDYEQSLTQVDKRMAIANCYRSVLNNPLFDDTCPEARIAENRIRKFIRGELEVLFGMRAAASVQVAVSQFTQEEVEALKIVAARLQKPADTSVIKPRVVQMSQPAKPRVSPVSSSPKPAPRHQAPPKVAQTAPQPVAQPTTPPKGVDLRIPEQYRENPTARVVNGKVYIQNTNSDGELLWVQDKVKGRRPMWKDVTPVARPTATMVQPIPMPSYSHQVALETQRSGNNNNSLENLAAQNPAMGQVAGAVAHSLMNG